MEATEAVGWTWGERDGTSTYCETYGDVRRGENESAYKSANEANGTTKTSCNEEEGTEPSLTERQLQRTQAPQNLI